MWAIANVSILRVESENVSKMIISVQKSSLHGTACKIIRMDGA